MGVRWSASFRICNPAPASWRCRGTPTTPDALGSLLCARFLGESRMTVFEAMGGPRERRRSGTAWEFDSRGLGGLNTIALEVIDAVGTRIPPRAPGLPDDWFEHDGQITKREMRALTISALAPRPREMLWDVGAGSGSVAIEWLLADPSLQAVAIERDPARAARIQSNAAALGVPDLSIIEGAAPQALAGLPAPDAVFLGGGISDAFEICWAALKPGGRLVANAVTLESQAEISALSRRFGGELLHVQLRARRAGRAVSRLPRSDAVGAMARGEAMSAAVGIGCRSGASADAIVRGVREALERAGLDTAPLYAPAAKRGPALDAAAARLGCDLRFCDEAALESVAARVVSHSPRVAALFGVGSVAEAAALFGAGDGARVVVAKFSADGVSCAVARGEP